MRQQAVRRMTDTTFPQPLAAAEIRALIRDRLALPGAPQMLLQLGVARITQTTARRPPADLIEQ
jgi:hypothetical protein